MAAYLGTDDTFDQAIAEFATRYADVNEADHLRLVEAVDRGQIVSWVVTVALAIAIVGALGAAGFVKAFLPVAIALTTTALGTLLVGAGVLSVAIFPMVAVRLRRRTGEPPRDRDEPQVPLRSDGSG